MRNSSHEPSHAACQVPSASVRSSIAGSDHVLQGSDAAGTQTGTIGRLARAGTRLFDGLKQQVLELVSPSYCSTSSEARVLPAACAALVAILCFWHPLAMCTSDSSSEQGSSSLWTIDRLRLAVTLLATFLLGGLARSEHIDLSRLMQRRLAASTEILYDLLPRHVADALLHDKELLVGTCPIEPSFSPANLETPFLMQEPDPLVAADAGLPPEVISRRLAFLAAANGYDSGVEAGSMRLLRRQLQGLPSLPQVRSMGTLDIDAESLQDLHPVQQRRHSMSGAHTSPLPCTLPQGALSNLSTHGHRCSVPVQGRLSAPCYADTTDEVVSGQRLSSACESSVSFLEQGADTSSIQAELSAQWQLGHGEVQDATAEKRPGRLTDPALRKGQHQGVLQGQSTHSTSMLLTSAPDLHARPNPQLAHSSTAPSSSPSRSKDALPPLHGGQARSRPTDAGDRWASASTSVATATTAVAAMIQRASNTALRTRMSLEPRLVQGSMRPNQQPLPRLLPHSGTGSATMAVGSALAESHESVTILFADVCGFTEFSRQMEPNDTFDMLNSLFASFESFLKWFPNIEKLDVIGDCFMAAAGLNNSQTPTAPPAQRDPAAQQGAQTDSPASAGTPSHSFTSSNAGTEHIAAKGPGCHHAASMVAFAHAILAEAQNHFLPGTNQPLQLRVGIHTGPLISGLVGSVRRKYTVIGPSVNTASRLESTSTPGCIHMSEDTYRLVAHLPQFSLAKSCTTELRGIGTMHTYLLAPPKLAYPAMWYKLLAESWQQGGSMSGTQPAGQSISFSGAGLGTVAPASTAGLHSGLLVEEALDGSQQKYEGKGGVRGALESLVDSGVMLCARAAEEDAASMFTAA